MKTKIKLQLLSMTLMGLIVPKIIKIYFELQLNKIAVKDWKELLNASIANGEFHLKNWYHRWYDDLSNPSDMMAVKVSARDENNLFRISKGRFALFNKPVSYWSGDYLGAKNEITPELRRDRDLTLDKMINHVPSGEIESITRYLVSKIPVLDLKNPSSLFLRLLEKNNIFPAEEFYSEVLSSRSKGVYPITHAISQLAIKNGFGAIAWRSVRSPIDGIVTTDTCLVVFEEHYLTTIRPPAADNE